MSGVVSAGFSTTVFPAASAGAIFHASISSGKFHGMICPATPSGFGRAVREGVLELVRPARVVEEMRGRERQVDVARLADRLAAVQRLEHGELARALLQDARRSGRGTSARSAPGGVDQPSSKRLARGRRRRARRPRPRPARSRRAAPRSAGEIVVVVVTRARLDPLAADEEAVALLERDDRRATRARGAYVPFGRDRRRGRRAVRARHQSIREVVRRLVDARSSPCGSASGRRSGATRRRSGRGRASASRGRGSRGRSTRYWIACFAARMPPAGFMPTRRPVSS